MDFLEIRKKAKERAAARAAGAPGAAPSGDRAPPEAPPAERRPRKGGGRRRGEPPAGVAGEVAARLHELPAPEGGVAPAARDDRFTTWRPGDGAPPFVPPPPSIGPASPPHEDDFKLIPVGVPAAPPPEPPPAPARPAADPLDEFFYRPDEEAPRLPQLAPAAAPRAEARALAREEYLTFLLGGEEYAVAIERVREIVRAPPITEVPRAPAHILGVVSVRGEVVAIVDPRRRLGLPGGPVAGEGKVVIVDDGEGPCGVLVDGVANVVRLPPGAIEPCPQAIASQGSDCLSGIGREADRLFTVLDVDALLRRAPARAPDADAPARRVDASA